MTEKERLGKHLLELREKISSKDYKKQYISQQELADNNNGLTKYLIGTVERGEANPTLNKLIFIAKALDLKTINILQVEINVDKYIKELEESRNN